MPPFRWIADAAAIIRNGEIDWQALQSRADGMRLGLTLRASLTFMDSLLPGLVPSRVLSDSADYSASTRELREFRVKANRFSLFRRIAFHWYNYQRVTEFLRKELGL